MKRRKKKKFPHFLFKKIKLKLKKEKALKL